ncbi:PilZ domain-containing protein [Sphingomonas sp.]|uniref:PilZ domain-containing protein n=1 Tax=Sphingomonas sp. TaxID=28214 RepID=UPI0033407DF1
MDQFSQDPFTPALEDGAHNRQVARDSLFLMADLRVFGEKDARPVRVRNLSQGGLMAEFPDGLAQGLRVEFDVRGIGWVSGQIAWSAAGRIGVAFDRQIDPMLARKPVGQGTHTPTFVKPIFTRTQR